MVMLVTDFAMITQNVPFCMFWPFPSIFMHMCETYIVPSHCCVMFLFVNMSNSFSHSAIDEHLNHAHIIISITIDIMFDF